MSPRVNSTHLNAARARLQSAHHVLIVAHVSPDGDAIGSLCGLGLALRGIGKIVTLACDDPVPDIYRFIPASGEVVKNFSANPTFDTYISVDCADLERTGKVGEAAGHAPDFNFDHHLTNPAFAEFNFVDADSAATAEVLYELFDPLGIPLTLQSAECLLAGLIADTIGFRTSNVNQRTLTTAQGLMSAGASLPKLYDLTLNRRSFTAARLWGEGLVRLQLEDGLVWTTLPLSARAAAGHKGWGDADLINVLTTIYDAKVAVIFVERPNGEVKISLRAHPGVDVSAVAQAFGGGGHAAAAGAEIKGTLEEVQARVLPAVRELIRKSGA